MKTILVLAEHPDFAEAVRAALDPERYRVVHRADLTAAEPLLSPQFLDACVLDLDLTLVQQLWTVEKLQRRLPRCPLLIYTSAKKAEWEEEAYLHGARQVLVKPVRPRLLSALVERLWTAETPAPPAVVPSPPPAVTAPATDTAFLRATPFQALETLSALRDFSAILGDSLCAEALLRQFLLRLREVLGVNRAAIFLLQTPPAPAPAQGRVVPGQRGAARGVCRGGGSQAAGNGLAHDRRRHLAPEPRRA